MPILYRLNLLDTTSTFRIFAKFVTMTQQKNISCLIGTYVYDATHTKFHTHGPSVSSDITTKLNNE